MRPQIANAVAVLRSIAEEPRNHFELKPIERRQAGRLWVGRLIRLRAGDVWELSEAGRAFLQHGSWLLH